MLGRAFIPNDYWEHFPLVEPTLIQNSLVDAHIYTVGELPNSVKLKAYNLSVTPLPPPAVSPLVSLQIELDVDGSTLTLFSAELEAFGAYYIFNESDVNLALGAVLIVQAIPTSWTSTTGVEFNPLIFSLHNVVFSIDDTQDKLQGDLEVTGAGGIVVESQDSNTLVISLDSVDCPDPCPQFPKVVRSINNEFTSLNHVGLQSRSYTISESAPHTVSIASFVEPCCDCEDQAPVWNAFVNELDNYNRAIEALDTIKDNYYELIDRLDLLSVDDCDEWAKIRDLYFNRNLFCDEVSDPEIVEHPENIFVNLGDNATFNVVATTQSPDPLTYQWQKFQNWVWTDIVGETSDSLTITDAQASDNQTLYRVIVTSSLGSARSNTAALRLNPQLPTIVTPPTNQIGSAGSNVVFTVSAAGQGVLSYQWQVDEGSGWQPLVGETLTSLFLINIALGMSGNEYRVLVSNSSGTIISSAATLTVQAISPSITTHPQSTTVNDSDSVTFSVVATGTAPLSYQWQVDEGSGWQPLVGETSTALTIPTVTASMTGNTYRVVVTGPGGSVNSNSAVLQVASVVPQITTQPSSIAISDGGTAVFSVSAIGELPLSYLWEFNDAGTWTSVPSGTSDTLVISDVDLSQDGSQYRVTVGNSHGVDISDTAILSVTPVAVSITQDPTSQTANDGDTVVFTGAAAGSSPISYQWQENPTGSILDWDNIVGETSSSLTISNVDTSKDGYLYRFMASNPYSSVTSLAATLSVDALAPSIITHPQSQTVNEGDTVQFTAVAAGTGPLSYQWEVYDGASWTSIGTNDSTLELTNVPPAITGYLYRVSVSNAQGTVVSNEAELTVIGTAIVITQQPVSLTVDDGETALFEVAVTGASPITYQWQVNTGSGWSSIQWQTSKVLVLNATFNMSGSQYRIVATNAVNTVISNIVTLTVNPLAADVVEDPEDATVPEGVNAVFEVLAIGTNREYQWEENDGSSWQPISGATSNLLVISAVTSALDGYTYRCRVTNFIVPSGVTSNSALLTVV